jgi:hypothetical protein
MTRRRRLVLRLVAAAAALGGVWYLYVQADLRLLLLYVLIVAGTLLLGTYAVIGRFPRF